MITVLLSLSVLAAAPAGAPNDPLASARVQTADLNLGTAAGRAELDRRVQHAVETVCPDAQRIADPREVQQVRICRTAALRTVDRQREQALAAATEGVEIASNGR